jgi:hypothetical protein
VTSGGNGGTSGDARQRTERLGIAVMMAAFMLQVVVNALSTIADRERVGSPIAPYEAWVWETSSFVVWLALVPVIWTAVRRLKPSRFGWPAVVAAHLALSFAVSVVHVTAMVAIRKLIYWALGSSYGFAPVVQQFFYEYRKDLSTYVAVAGLIAVVQWVAARHGERAETAPPQPIVVRDGSRTHFLAADDIDYVEAAGNYVAVHGANGEVLRRTTLSAMEAELPEGAFVRIHRSRLVRLAAIARVDTNANGDFEVELKSGARIAGSRRYRSRLTRYERFRS